MKKQFKAGGLLLVAVSGLTASSTVGVVSANTKETADVGSVSRLEGSGKSSVLDFIDCLDYGEQKKIYKGLTANKFGLFGKDLLDVRKNDIAKDFLNLYKKDTKKFNTYIKDNYGLNLVVYDWMKDPAKKEDLDKLLDKINENEKAKQEKALKDGKTFIPKFVTGMDLMNSPALALDYALEEESSSLIPNCNKSIISEKVKENAKYIGVNESFLNSIGGSLGILDSSLKGKPGQSIFRNIVVDTLDGKRTTIPTSNKIKSLAKDSAVAAGLVFLGFSAYRFFKRGYNRLFGIKKKDEDSKKGKVTPSIEEMLKPFPD